MNEFLPVPRLFNEILSLSFELGDEVTIIPSQIKELNPPISFPILNSDVILEITSRLEKNPNIIQAFDNISWNYPFDFSLSTLILASFGLLSTNVPKYTAILILNTYIALVISESNSEHISLVFELLKLVVSSSNSTISYELRYLAASAFSSFYNFSGNIIQSPDLSQYIQNLRSFLITNQDIPKSAFALLTPVAQKVLDSKTMFETFVNHAEFIFTKCKSRFTKDEIEGFVRLICDPKIKPSIPILHILSIIVELTGKDSCFPYIVSLPYVIKELIFSKQNMIPINDTSNLIPFKLQTIESPSNTITETFFHGLPDIQYMPKSISDNTIDEFMDKDVVSFCNGVSELLIADTTFPVSFSESIIFHIKEQLSSPRFLDLAAAYIYTIKLTQARSRKLFVPKLGSLLTSPLFDPRITFYDHFPHFDAISAMRQEVISMFIASNFEVVKMILDYMFQFPYMFSEVIMRIARLPDYMFNYNFITAEYFCELLQKSRSIPINQVNEEAIQYVRISLIYLLSRLLHVTYFADYLMENSTFLNELFSYTYDLNMSSFITQHITAYILRPSTLKPNDLFEVIKSNISVVLQGQFKKTNEVLIAIHYIKLLNSVLKQKTTFIKYFEKSIIKMIERTSDLSNLQVSQDYIFELLTLLVTVSNYIDYSRSDLMKIKLGIRKIHGKDPPLAIFQKLIEISACTQLRKVEPTFLIVKPKAINLILNVFENSKVFISILIFLKKLAEFSIDNIHTLHKATTDIEIIDIIKNNESEIIAKHAFDVLKVISTEVCSGTVVNRFISLLWPIEEKYRLTHQELAFDFITNLIIDAGKTPEVGFPISNTNVTQFHYFSSDILLSSSFFGWFYINSTDKKITLATFADELGTNINIEVYDGLLRATMISEGKIWTGPSTIFCPVSRWFPLSATISTNYTSQLYVFLYLSPEECCRPTFPIPTVKPGKALLQISNEDNPEKVGLIGPFGIFNELTPIKRAQIFEFYVNSIPERFDNLLLWAKPTKESDKIVFKQYPENKYKIAYEPPLNRSSLTFLNILSNRLGISVLIPMYGELDLPYRNGQRLKDGAVKYTRLLRRLVTICRKPQIEFMQNEGFNIIVHLLESASPEHRTFELYNDFYNFLNNFPENSRENLFKTVLLNFNLWLLSNDFERITYHWGHVLYPTYPELCNEIMPISKLLLMARSYLYYEPIEGGIMAPMGKMKRPNYNIKMIRRNIFTTCLSLKKKLKTEDVNLIINQIITNGEKQQVIELLDFLSDIVISSNEIDYSHLILIDNLIATLDLDIIIQMLFTIRTLSKTIIAFIIEEQLEYIITQLPNILINPDFLTRLIEICKSDKIYFPLLAYVSSYKEEYCTIVYNEIQPSPELFSSSYSPLFSVYSMIVYSEKTKSKIQTFLINCGPKVWTKAYYMLELIANAFMFNSLDICRNYIKEISQRFKDSPLTRSVGETDAFLHIMRTFLFTKPCNYISNTYKELSKDCSDTFSTTFDSLTDGFGSDLLESVTMSQEQLEQLEEEEKLEQLNQENSEENSEKTMKRDGSSEFLSISRLIKEKLMNSSVIMKNPPPRKINAITPVVLFTTCKNFIRISGGKQNSSFNTPYKVLMSELTEEMCEETISVRIRNKLTNSVMIRRFGIMTDENGNWTETELASLALDVFSFCPLKKHVSTLILICSYLLRNGSEKGKEFMENSPMLTRELLPDHCVYNAFATKTNNKIIEIGKLPYSEMLKISDFALSNVARDDLCVNYFKSYIDFLSLFTEKSLKTQQYTQEPIFNEQISLTQKLMMDRSVVSNRNRQTWRKFWSRQTIEGYPWHNAVKYGTDEIVKKRIPVICSFFVPMKVKKVYVSSDTIKMRTKSVFLDRNDETEGNYEEKTEDDNNKQDFTLETTTAEDITISSSIPVSVSITTNSIIIDRRLDSNIKVIKLKKIESVLLKPTGKDYSSLEINLNNGTNVLLKLKGKLTAFEFLVTLSSLNINTLRFPIQKTGTPEYFAATNYTKLWVTGRMSNFEYLIALNVFAGRSFNSLNQYPIFPWLLTNYDDGDVDFSGDLSVVNSKFFRDLSKPIGSMNPNRLKILAKVAKEMKYLYDNFISTPQRTLEMLSSIEPFRSLYKGEKPKSIQDIFKKSYNDYGFYEESVPEYYFLPESVEGMKLPKWANNSAFMFVYLNRKILESEQVSQNLHRWIHLVFGSGRNDDMNTFNPVIYEGSDQTRGVCPTQLFKSFHPPRKVVDKKLLKHSIMSPFSSDLRGVCVIKKDKDEITVLALDKNSFIRTLRFNPEKSTTKLINEKQFNIPLTMSNSAEGLNILIPITSLKFMMIGTKKDRVQLISLESETEREVVFHSNITAYDFSSNYMAFAQTDSTISIYKHSESMIFSIQLNAGTIEALAVSAIFQMVAVGTREGEIYLVSILSKHVTQILNLESFVCTNLVITKNWGFIVAFCEGLDDTNLAAKIVVYTCNGVKVAEYPINRLPTFVCSFNDRYGFDHIIFTNSNQEMFLFEAPFPEKMTKVCDKIGDSLYIEQWGSRSLIAITTDGSVHVIPVF